MPKDNSPKHAQRKDRAELKPLCVRLATAAQALDIGVHKLRALINAKEIAAVKSGKCVLVKVEELERYVATLKSPQYKKYVRRAKEAA